MGLRRGLVRAGRLLIAVIAVLVVAVSGSPGAASDPANGGARAAGVRGRGTSWAFTNDSFWNEPHDNVATFPTDPNSSTYISHLKAAVPADTKYVELAGADNDAWGVPYYRSVTGSALVTVTCEQANPGDCYGFPVPPSGKPRIQVRLPSAAKPSDSVDSELVLIDRTPGTNQVTWFWHICPPKPFANAFCTGRFDHWVASGLSTHILSSDGLDGCWERYYSSDFPNGSVQNQGHRGFSGAYVAIRYTEVADSGIIPHVLKLNIPNTGSNHWFPFTGDEDNGTSDKIPEGILFRLKPSVDLSRFHLSPAALTIAQALQTYGAVVGDTSGTSANVMMENLYVEGTSSRWSDIGVGPDALSAIGLDNYEFVSRGAGGPSPSASPCARDPV